MFHFVMDITGFKFWIPVSIVNFGYVIGLPFFIFISDASNDGYG